MILNEYTPAVTSYHISTNVLYTHSLVSMDMMVPGCQAVYTLIVKPLF